MKTELDEEALSVWTIRRDDAFFPASNIPYADAMAFCRELWWPFMCTHRTYKMYFGVNAIWSFESNKSVLSTADVISEEPVGTGLSSLSLVWEKDWKIPFSAISLHRIKLNIHTTMPMYESRLKSSNTNPKSQHLAMSPSTKRGCEIGRNYIRDINNHKSLEHQFCGDISARSDSKYGKCPTKSMW